MFQYVAKIGHFRLGYGAEIEVRQAADLSPEFNPSPRIGQLADGTFRLPADEDSNNPWPYWTQPRNC